MTYGIMPPKDYETLDKTLDLVCKTFPEGVLQTLEIGVHKGDGSRGINNFLKSRGRINFHTGIDNQRDFAMGSPFPECNFIVGNSIEVYNQVFNDTQNFILIDACHNYPMTMADFLVYSDKVTAGGFIAFHDTGKHIPLFKDYQGMGPKDDPDMYIACRKAVSKLGLLDDVYPGWKLIFDEADPAHDTGGIVVVQKIKNKQ